MINKSSKNKHVRSFSSFLPPTPLLILHCGLLSEVSVSIDRIFAQTSGFLTYYLFSPLPLSFYRFIRCMCFRSSAFYEVYRPLRRETAGRRVCLGRRRSRGAIKAVTASDEGLYVLAIQTFFFFAPLFLSYRSRKKCNFLPSFPHWPKEENTLNFKPDVWLTSAFA